MDSRISYNANDNSLNVRTFGGFMSNPNDVKDIGQDLEVTCNDAIAGMTEGAGVTYEYSYELVLTRKEINT